jgi:hypothetical protein
MIALVFAPITVFAADGEKAPPSEGGLLEVTALDAETFKPAPGTVFTVESADAGFYVRLVAGTDGKATLSLPPGKYVVKEAFGTDIVTCDVFGAEIADKSCVVIVVGRFVSFGAEIIFV